MEAALTMMKMARHCSPLTRFLSSTMESSAAKTMRAFITAENMEERR